MGRDEARGLAEGDLGSHPDLVTDELDIDFIPDEFLCIFIYMDREIE